MSSTRSAVPKIIIKARTSTGQAESVPQAEPSRRGRSQHQPQDEPNVEDENAATNDDNDQEMQEDDAEDEYQDEDGSGEEQGDGDAMNVDEPEGEGDAEGEGEGDDDESGRGASEDPLNLKEGSRPVGSEEDGEGADDNPEPEVVVPQPRKRGRPRGRGRGGGFAGTSTPRGAPRGRPRGRGRGRGRGGAAARGTKRDPDEDDVEEDEDGRPFRKIHGEPYIIEGDEFITPEDPKGNTKIDKDGNLLGGRRFKAQTFTIPNRHPTRQYMLAIEAARTSGFRDSLYYFRRNLLALKLNATQPEKDYLIAEGKLGNHLKTRSVTLITARSAFKLHGSKMLIDGRWVTDDYYEDKALIEATEKGFKAGDYVGDLSDPHAAQSSAAAELASLSMSKAERLASGAGGLYRAGGPTTIFGGSGWGPYSDGPLNAVRKSLLTRDGVSEENWMFMMASRIREADEEWGKWRQEARRRVEGVEGLWTGQVPVPGAGRVKGSYTNTDVGSEDGPLGAYEPHSHVIHYRSDTQPTSARWVPLPDSTSNTLQRRCLGGTKTGNGAWGLAWVDTVMETPSSDVDPKWGTGEGAREREWLWKQVEQDLAADRESIASRSQVASAVATPAPS